MRALEADPKQTVGGAARRARARAVAVVLYVAAVCAFAASGVAQQAPPAPLAQTASPATTAQEMPPVEAPRPPQQRGPVDTFGRWITGSISAAGDRIGAAWGSLSKLGTRASDAASDVAKGAAAVAGGTAQAVGQLPVGPIVAGRELCATAANGAPDCQAAVDRLCRTRGFATGASIDVESAKTCRPEVVLSGRQRSPADCLSEDFVTKAVCR